MARGGSLIATGETSLYDENGERRADFGLGDLFGVALPGRPTPPLKNSYLRLEWPPAGQPAHPLLAGLEGAQRIIGGVSWLDVAPITPLAEMPSP